MKESITLKDVFAIAEQDSPSGEPNSRWTKIGVGFVNRDNSINVVLDAMPLNGRFHIRDRQKKVQTQQPMQQTRRSA